MSGYSSSNSVLAQYGIQEPLVINGRKKRELRGMMMNKDTNSRNYKTTTKSTRILKRPNPKKAKTLFKKSSKTLKNTKAQGKSEGKLRKEVKGKGTPGKSSGKVKGKVVKGRSSRKLTKEVKGKETKGKSKGKLSKEEKRELERKRKRKQKRNQKELSGR